MYVERICVEEGFLHGLDLALGPGLTVLIGARGSGKTSIIELIRFATEAPSYSQTAADAARRQALAVLGSGKVTVTLNVDGEAVTLSRSAEELAARRSTDLRFPLPIVLSQSEIEQVGLHPDSRRRLLDGFVPSLSENELAEEASRALIGSLTVELRSVLQEIRAEEEDVVRLLSVSADLDSARLEAIAAHENLEQTAPQRDRLSAIGNVLAATSVRLALYERAEAALEQRLQRLRHASAPTPLDSWPAAASTDDRLSSVRALVSEATDNVVAALGRIQEGIEQIGRMREQEQADHLALEDEARQLRTFIDQVSQGAGVLMKRVSDLEVEQARAAALREHLKALTIRAAGISDRRESELDRLDDVREARVNAREQAASFLNARLGPKIRITVNRYGSVRSYIDTLTETLRGSGLQYNLLAPDLARLISPRELTSAVERNDPDSIVSITGITQDRAQRLVSHLRAVGTEDILTVPLGDTVDLSLLDGGAYKLAEELSVGQRCTTVLPIILSHNERVLIVDQPEDNLDNSFVAETLVKALRNRSNTAQLVFATHNPNVPVLGEADKVVHLTSDGRRCEVRHVAVLDDTRSVNAISNVMEGGRRAFETRAAFYAAEFDADEPS